MPVFPGAQPVETQVRQAFDLFDLDGSGFIEHHEFQLMAHSLGVTLSDEEVTTTIGTLDKDGDGKIDFDEFVSWWVSGVTTPGGSSNPGFPSAPEAQELHLRLTTANYMYQGEQLLERIRVAQENMAAPAADANKGIRATIRADLGDFTDDDFQCGFHIHASSDQAAATAARESFGMDEGAPGGVRLEFLIKDGVADADVDALAGDFTDLMEFVGMMLPVEAPTVEVATNDGGGKVIRMTMAVPQLPQVAMAQQMYTQFGINITDLTVDFHTNANPVGEAPAVLKASALVTAAVAKGTVDQAREMARAFLPPQGPGADPMAFLGWLRNGTFRVKFDQAEDELVQEALDMWKMGMMQMESSMAMLALMGDEGPAGQAKKIYFGVLDSVESVSLVKAFFADLVLEITFPNLALTALFPDRETLDQMAAMMMGGMGGPPMGGMGGPPMGEDVQYGFNPLDMGVDAMEAGGGGGVRTHHMQFCLMGNDGVGKTAIVQRLCYGQYDADDTGDHSVEVANLQAPGNNYSVQVFDLGNEAAAGMVDFCNAIVIIFDGTDHGSYDDALAQHATLGGFANVYFVMNKADGAVAVSDEELAAMPNGPVAKVSAVTGDGVTEAFLSIAARAAN